MGDDGAETKSFVVCSLWHWKVLFEKVILVLVLLLVITVKADRISSTGELDVSCLFPHCGRLASRHTKL